VAFGFFGEEDPSVGRKWTRERLAAHSCCSYGGLYKAEKTVREMGDGERERERETIRANH